MLTANITFVGNVTREPELRYTTGGTAVASFGVAVNRRYQVNGEWQEETSFLDCVTWKDLAENAAASLPKGTRVIVNGELRQRDWEDRDGNSRKSLEVTVEAIGPDLRWAQAHVERNERSGGQGGSSGGNTGQGRSSRQTTAEEPF